MTNYQAWIPTEVLEILKSLKRDLAGRPSKSRGDRYPWGAEELTRFERLFTATGPGIQKVWRFVGAQGIYKNVLPHSCLFAHNAFSGIMGPLRGAGMSQGKQDTWKKQVAGAANKLATLIRCTELDEYLIKRRQATLWRFRSEQINDSMRNGLPAPALANDVYEDHTSFSDVLNEFAKWGIKSVRPVPLKRPHGPEAPRTYFILTLADYFRSTTGKPQCQIIVEATSVIFTDFPEIDLRQVQKIVGPARTISVAAGVTKSKKKQK